MNQTILHWARSSSRFIERKFRSGTLPLLPPHNPPHQKCLPMLRQDHWLGRSYITAGTLPGSGPGCGRRAWFRSGRGTPTTGEPSGREGEQESSPSLAAAGRVCTSPKLSRCPGYDGRHGPADPRSFAVKAMRNRYITMRNEDFWNLDDACAFANISFMVSQKALIDKALSGTLGS